MARSPAEALSNEPGSAVVRPLRLLQHPVDRRQAPRAGLQETDIEYLKAQVLEPRISRLWSHAKRGVDFVGALAITILASPLLLAIYLLVLRSGGNPIYGHRRIGRGGRWFTCYKFRTMIPDSAEVLERVLAENPEMLQEWERDEKLRNDPRVTRIGEFLRRTSLDELPQLLNVLRGEMSLVGPRPATETGICHYGKAVRWYLAVRPGMTGLWQVSGRNDVGFRRRVVMDIYYVRTQSFILDAQILLRTIRVVLGANGY